MKALVYLVFRNSILSVLDEGSKQEGESIENGIITSVTHGVMTGICHTSRIFQFIQNLLLRQTSGKSMGDIGFPASSQ